MNKLTKKEKITVTIIPLKTHHNQYSSKNYFTLRYKLVFINKGGWHARTTALALFIY